MLNSIELIRQIKGNDAERYVGYYARLDIIKESSLHGERNVIDVLIDGLLDLITELCRQNPEYAHDILESYLRGSHIIFQRIALHILRTSGGQFIDLLQLVFENREDLNNRMYSSEYQGLLRDQFNKVSTATKEKTVSWIIEGPSDLDARAKQRAEWENREITPKDRLDITEVWILKYLSLIKLELTGKSLDILSSLEASQVFPTSLKDQKFRQRFPGAAALAPFP